MDDLDGLQSRNEKYASAGQISNVSTNSAFAKLNMSTFLNKMAT